ncbi:MAG: ferritin-like domain-containing protein [Lyngbya sp.]|nr:ferritin-like domain-containing protein [Lyngbya sp.]
MSNRDSENSMQWKIFPRNLTAKADYIVQGNPANTRLESGVDNCYPGLEFDQRNLDKAFFPGLIFEFHRDDGAILREIIPDGVPAEAGLTQADLESHLYLGILIGKTTAEQNEQPPVFFLDKLDGLEVWRRVHDLLPGKIGIVLGSQPDVDLELLVELLQELGVWDPNLNLIANLSLFSASGNNGVKRKDGKIVAVFSGDREQYLDEDGVINVDVYEPGDMTRSLCAPWQYDFRDCGCFYWAASKPDIVSSADGNQPYLNFQRKDRNKVFEPSEVNEQWQRNQEIDYAELINGAWNELPVVLNDQESEIFAPLVNNLMSRQQVIDELNYLATVEHALCIEYLYAHYSLNAPMRLPDTGASEQTKHIFAAANEVFMIAVDEMRHLRWVNEALDLLGQPPSLGRAESLGRIFNRPFQLKPLTPEQLQWFIDVEKPSQSVNEGLDGMYVQLLISIDRQPDIFPERERLLYLIKLIIDEGGDHYQRFKSVQQHLSDMIPEIYLRPLENPQPGSQLASLQQLSDQNYAVLLGSLEISFSLGDRAGGLVLEQSRRAMFNLHEANHYLASQGVQAQFKLPPAPPRLPFTAPLAHAHVNTLSSGMRDAISSMRDVGNNTEKAMAERQLQINDELFAVMHNLITEDLGE